ncbi:hypothetical protein ACWGQQ_36025, partial [Bradyrhizobium sp. Lot33]
LEADDFFNRYALSPAAQREARLRSIFDCDLLVLDDLFFARTIPDEAGALLQTLIHQRYKLHLARNCLHLCHSCLCRPALGIVQKLDRLAAHGIAIILILTLSVTATLLAPLPSFRVVSRS